MSLFDVIFTESVPRKRKLHERKRREARGSLANIVEDLLRVANVELVPRPQHTAIAVTITPQLLFAHTRKSADVALQMRARLSPIVCGEAGVVVVAQRPLQRPASSDE
jgi:hypothetical protein